jgi:voltage-gated potassium channel Kch
MKMPTKENNFIWMTLALVATLLFGALTEEFPEATALRVADYFNILFLLIAVISLRKDVSWFKVLLFIIVCMAVVSFVKRRFDLPGVDIAYMLFLLCFYVAAIRLVGREVLLTGSVDLNKVIGSIALYFMLGLFFSALFTLLLHFSPDALRGLEVNRPLDQISSTVYFSFVTLTTLGYGDISPATPLARFLVILESVTGMFYLAMIVASLVGSLKRTG